jgi:Rps23 Pro-64 3,4-dihydroxylase Tpa1-like proline 4-hydroxylase
MRRTVPERVNAVEGSLEHDVSGVPRFRLNPELDARLLELEFAERRRVQVPDFLAAECAAAMLIELRKRNDWRQVVNSGANVYDLDRATRERMPPHAASALDDAVYAGARSGFQHRYEAIRVPDGEPERSASADPLAAFASFMSSGEARDFLRRVTGSAEIAFADAQATSYSPGDFLTAHDDAVDGKGRLAAYVLSLTSGWRADWGGLLLFHDDDGLSIDGLVPRFNTLNLFAVPQVHSVSIVSRAAPYRRYSITGWLRSS